MRFTVACFFVVLCTPLVSGCGDHTAQQCMTMGGATELVTNAQLFRLDVYPDSVACDGSDVPPGNVPIVSQTFKPGDDIKLSVAPGKRTLVLTTYADAAGTV